MATEDEKNKTQQEPGLVSNESAESFQASIPKSSGHHLGLGDLLKLSLRTFRVRPLRTFLTILGISVGIGTVFFLISLGYGLQYILVGRLASTEDSLVSLEAFYPGEGGLSINQDAVNKYANSEFSSEVSPIAEYPGEIKTDDGLTGSLIVKIIEPNYFRLSGLQPDIGRPFTDGEHVILVSNTALKLLNWKEDKTSLAKWLSVRILYQNDTGTDVKVVDIPVRTAVSGIIMDEFQPPFIFIPRGLVPEAPPSYQRMFVKAKDINTVEQLRDKMISEGFLISARIDLVNQAKNITTAITVTLGIFGVAALVVSAIGMFNTMSISFLERIFEVGIMKSIGATTQDIRNLFLMESLVIGVMGGLGGLTLGFVGGQLFNLGLNLLANYLGGKPMSLFIYPTQFVVLVLILSGLVGAMAGFWPARRAAKLSAREAFLRK